MKILKPIFFAKYRPKEFYEYPDWDDVSIFVNSLKMSVLTKKTSLKPKGVVVLCHPQLSEAKQFFVKMEHDEMYRNIGFHTVIFDFNGLGESQDRDLDFATDIHEVLKLTKSLYPDLPIVLHGVSFGGSQLIIGALKDQNLVDKIIIENSITSTEEYYKHRKYNLQYKVIKIYNFLFPKKKEEMHYSKRIKKLNNIPKLFIYGTNDVKTPIWMGQELYEKAQEPKQIEIFDTRHLTSIVEEEVKYNALITDFVT